MTIDDKRLLNCSDPHIDKRWQTDADEFSSDFRLFGLVLFAQTFVIVNELNLFILQLWREMRFNAGIYLKIYIHVKIEQWHICVCAFVLFFFLTIDFSVRMKSLLPSFIILAAH